MNKKKKMKRNWLILTIVLFSIGLCTLFFGVTGMTSSSYEIDETNIVIHIKNSLNTTAIDPTALDQKQETANIALYCDPLKKRQDVVDDRTPLKGASFAVGRHGSPTDDLNLCLLGGSANYVGTLPASSLPAADTLYWVDFDISSTPISATNVQLIAWSNDNTHDGTYWMWGASDTNTYAKGGSYYWDGASWISLGNSDLAFRTYTIPTGGGGGAPTIAISIANWQITILGSGFLFAALASGIKYGLIIIH